MTFKHDSIKNLKYMNHKTNETHKTEMADELMNITELCLHNTILGL